jgi:hypothetical protein
MEATMNFPDGFNDAAFERIFGSRATDAELAKEAKQERVFKVIDEAFATESGKGFLETMYAWNSVKLAIDAAAPSADKHKLELAKEAFFDNDKEGTLQIVNEILGA